jgi:hypothetical protein
MGALHDLRGVVSAISSDAYPAFVTSGALNGEIPAFYYHKLEAEQLEGHLRYLNRNGYRALDAGEHLRSLLRCEDPGRCAVLTFDDGLADLYEVAFPLLRAHRVKAVAFIIPGRVGEPGLVSWSQVREMHESGWLDFQSHSMFHVAIPTQLEAKDFFRPDFVVSRPWDLPVPSSWSGERPLFPPAWGTPIRPSLSRLSDARRILVPEEVDGRVVEETARRGGAAFFEQRGWRRILEDCASRGLGSSGGRLERADEQKEGIRKELVESKRRIEAELAGKVVAHLAYPWHQMGELVQQLLPECGYLSAYAGLTEGKGPRSAEGRLFQLARLSADFLPCLPGEGRQSVGRVLARKIRRRLTQGTPY